MTGRRLKPPVRFSRATLSQLKKLSTGDVKGMDQETTKIWVEIAEAVESGCLSQASIESTDQTSSTRGRKKRARVALSALLDEDKDSPTAMMSKAHRALAIVRRGSDDTSTILNEMFIFGTYVFDLFSPKKKHMGKFPLLFTPVVVVAVVAIFSYMSGQYAAYETELQFRACEAEIVSHRGALTHARSDMNAEVNTALSRLNRGCSLATHRATVPRGVLGPCV